MYVEVTRLPHVPNNSINLANYYRKGSIVLSNTCDAQVLSN